MSYEYSENIRIQGAAGDLLHDELGRDIAYAYNTEPLSEDDTLKAGRSMKRARNARNG